MKDELGEKTIPKFMGLRTKTYSYLIDDGSEDKKGKRRKKYVIKRKRKFENYKNCLEGTQFENKINHLEKNKITVGSLEKDHKEFLKSNKLILKTQQRCKSGRLNLFTR